SWFFSKDWLRYRAIASGLSRNLTFRSPLSFETGIFSTNDSWQVCPLRYSFFGESRYFFAHYIRCRSGALLWSSFMKKFILALASLAAFSGSALAADLGARPYVKAPPPVAPVYNWTGFYVFGGGGGGLWAADQFVQDTATLTPLTINQRQGGSGWFGTV